MANPFRQELRRLGRGYARCEGARRASRWHLVLLVAACVLAFVSRALFPLPVLAWMEGRWLPTLFVALGLVLLGIPLVLLASRLARPNGRRLADELDDRFDLQDQASTAAEVERDAAQAPVVGALLSQAGRALARISPERLWRKRRRVPFVRGLLGIVFAFLLLAPGVDGLGKAFGLGREGTGGLGATAGDPVDGTRRALAMDEWLAWFVTDPLPVEPLPDAPSPDVGDASK